MNANKLYTPKEAAEILDLGPELIRKYCDFFSIQTEWTKENKKGHRRFKRENIEELLEIKKLIQQDKLSWENVRSYRNGEEDSFIQTEQKSLIEKKIDILLEEQKLQREFNEELLSRLETMTLAFQKSEERRLQIEEKIALVEETKEKSNGFFSNLFKKRF